MAEPLSALRNRLAQPDVATQQYLALLRSLAQQEDYKPVDRATANESMVEAAPPVDPFAAAAARVRAPYKNLPEPGTSPLPQVAEDLLLPHSTTDLALMAATGGMGKLMSTGAKIAMIAGGRMLSADPAEAGAAGAAKPVLTAMQKLMAKAARAKTATELPATMVQQPPFLSESMRNLPPLETLGATSKINAGEINRAAAESRQGMTQPELRRLYDQIGLTGGEASDLVKPSLAARQPAEAVQAAKDLKLADRAALNRMTPAERKVYGEDQVLPEGFVFPSQEAARPATEAYEPIKKEVMRAEKAFDQGVAGGTKPSLFDLSPDTLMKTPDVPQFQLPRVAPEATDRLSSVARGGMARLERAAGNAAEGNWGWYNLMQARDVFHGLHGQQKGEQAFQAWLDGVAGTSMVNPIDNNIRSSTWYLQQMLQGKAMPEVIALRDPETGKMVRTMAGGPPPGYGAKSQIQHADRVRDYMTHTYDPVSNPKPISYRMNLSGNWVPRTVDTHDIRNMVGMPHALEAFGADEASLLPKEYSYLEDVGRRAAVRAGSPQAAQQAATWVGGGPYTKLKSFPAPLLEALNRRAHVTGMVRGQSPWDALLDAFRGHDPLL